MPAIMNDLVNNIIAHAIIGMIIFCIGLVILFFVIIYIVCVINVSISSNNIGQIITEMLSLLVLFLLIVNGMFLYQKYDDYKINNRKLGLVEQVLCIKKDQEALETITIDSNVSISVESSNSLAYLKIDSQDHSIPLGEESSDYCQNIKALIFEKYDYLNAQNAIEMYKNSGLIKSINGVNVDDKKAVEKFVLTKKNGLVDGKMFYLFEATLDITENGIAIKPKYLTAKQYFENPNLMFYVYMLNETTQTYQKVAQKDMTNEKTLMLRETGKYKICVINKNNPSQEVSDSIICEVNDTQIISLQIVDKKWECCEIV